MLSNWMDLTLIHIICNAIINALLYNGLTHRFNLIWIVCISKRREWTYVINFDSCIIDVWFDVRILSQVTVISILVFFFTRKLYIYIHIFFFSIHYHYYFFNPICCFMVIIANNRLWFEIVQSIILINQKIVFKKKKKFI